MHTVRSKLQTLALAALIRNRPSYPSRRRVIVALDIERSTSRPDPVKAEVRTMLYALFDAALMRKAAATGRSQVVAIGVAQEYQRVFTGTKDRTPTGAVWFSYNRTERRVTCYYFYLWDEGLGPAFIKFCGYFPVRHEAPCDRVEVKDLHRHVVAAA